MQSNIVWRSLNTIIDVSEQNVTYFPFAVFFDIEETCIGGVIKRGNTVFQHMLSVLNTTVEGFFRIRNEVFYYAVSSRCRMLREPFEVAVVAFYA